MAKTTQSARDIRLKNQGHDDDENAEPGDDLTNRKLPKIKEIDETTGVVKEVAMDLGQNMVPCCGAPPPAGSWYGPFGFFRAMGYAFMLLSLFGIISAIYSGITRDFYQMAMSIVMIFAAFIAAVSAYCHEGLSNEVGVFARQNDEFARENDSMSSQLEDLEHVKQEYESVLEELQGDTDALNNLVESLHRIVLMKNLSTIFAAYMEADRNKDEDISAEEVDTFFSTIWEILNLVAGNFPLDLLYKEAVHAGFDKAAKRAAIDKEDVKHIIYAVSLYGDHDRPCATQALLWLVLFSFDPDMYAEQLKEHLISAILGSDAADQQEEEIRSQVDTVKDHYDGGFKLSNDTSPFKCKQWVERVLKDVESGRPGGGDTSTRSQSSR